MLFWLVVSSILISADSPPLIALQTRLSVTSHHSSTHSSLSDSICIWHFLCPFISSSKPTIILEGKPVTEGLNRRVLGGRPFCVSGTQIWEFYRIIGTRLLIFLPAVLIPACASSSLAFCMMYSAYKLNKQSDNVQPWHTSFPDLEQVCCSMSSSNCCFLTCIPISQEAGQVVWYSHLFKNFPEFVVIHTVNWGTELNW